MEIDYYFNNAVLLFKPEKYVDDRGFFSETYNQKELQKLGVKTKFVQDNFSFSRSKPSSLIPFCSYPGIDLNEYFISCKGNTVANN